VSRRADAVLYNSVVSRAQHEAIGYRADIGAVIPNGFDTEGFRPDAGHRARTRLRLGLTDSDFVVGIVGRFHPVKDHATFVTAAGLLAETLPRACFLVVGPGCTPDNASLQEMLVMHGHGACFQLLGDWGDTRTLYPALDALCLTSRSEGFPNVLGEAMSCGVPCLATAVGDIPSLVGDPEWLIQPGDSKMFASRLRALADLDSVSRCRLADKVRARIVSKFGIDSIVERYLQFYARARENPRRAN
jgi:glycosyltransferase involved in cell wall biosynthesis